MEENLDEMEDEILEVSENDDSEDDELSLFMKLFADDDSDDEVFEFDSVKMNVNEMRKMHGIAECNTFYPLNEEYIYQYF